MSTAAFDGAQLRAFYEDDPNIEKIARTLGLSREALLDRLGKFKGPTFTTAPGYDPAQDAGKVETAVRRVVARLAREVGRGRDGFERAKDALFGPRIAPAAPVKARPVAERMADPVARELFGKWLGRQR